MSWLDPGDATINRGDKIAVGEGTEGQARTTLSHHTLQTQTGTQYCIIEEVQMATPAGLCSLSPGSVMLQLLDKPATRPPRLNCLPGGLCSAAGVMPLTLTSLARLPQTQVMSAGPGRGPSLSCPSAHWAPGLPLAQLPPLPGVAPWRYPQMFTVTHEECRCQAKASVG